MLLLAFLGLLGMQAFAQKTITGTVFNAEDGKTLPGVSVLVKGTTIATVTDIDGKYILKNVPEDATVLVFSFIGMKSQEVSISGNVVDCNLEKEDVSIDEVIVTALGISREQKALGYSATNVNNEEFEKNISLNAMNSLQGKVAGVVVTSGGGTPGSSTKVIIRGYSSVSGGNNPLYVIDGVPIDNTSRTADGIDFGNRANDINPNDIESMTILKGAAATSQYGPRGANGVIIITTKKGTKEGFSVELLSSITTSDIIRLPQMQNTFGEGWDGYWKHDENGSWGPIMDGKLRLWGNEFNNTQKVKLFQAVPNNLYEFYDYGYQYNNAVSLSGGDIKSNFYVSFGNNSANGILPGNVDTYSKNSIRFNGERKGKFLSVSISANYVRTDGNQNPDGMGGTNSAANIYSELIQIPRDFSIVDLQDYKNDPFNTADYYFTPYAYNPYFAINENQSHLFENRFYGSVTIKAELTKWLTITYRPGVDASALQRKEWEAIFKLSPESPNFGTQKENPGFFSQTTTSTTEMNQDFMLIAKHSFGKINLNGLLGYQTYSRDFNSLFGQINSLVIPNFYSLDNTSEARETQNRNTRKRLYGYYAQLDFDYSSIVYLTLTGRRDHSSTLPLDNNSFFYPSASFSFILTNLVDLSSFADLIKVRASWGKAGNDANPYLLYPVYSSGSIWVPFSTLEFPINGVGAYELGNIIGNPNLKPEITTEQELGFDIRLFKNRVNFDFALYNRISDGQILQVLIPASSGFASQTINFGQVQNKGIELLATFVPVRTKNFTWQLTANFTKNSNLVKNLPEDSKEIILTRAYDVEMVAIEGRPLGVLRAPDFVRDSTTGKVIVGDGGLPLSTTTKTEIGTVQPNYILGITNSFNIKGVDFSFTIDTRQGGFMYTGTGDLNYFVGNAPQTTFNERQPFIVPNSLKENPDYDPTDPNSPKYIENDIAIDMAHIDDYYYTSSNKVMNRERVIDRSYTKLRNVTISYSLPTFSISKYKIKGIQVVLAGNNLLLWTPYENNHIDPESTSFGNDLTGDFGEFRTSPTLRSFTATLRVKF